MQANRISWCEKLSATIWSWISDNKFSFDERRDWIVADSQTMKKTVYGLLHCDLWMRTAIQTWGSYSLLCFFNSFTKLQLIFFCTIVRYISISYAKFRYSSLRVGLNYVYICFFSDIETHQTGTSFVYILIHSLYSWIPSKISIVLI